jgi:rubrerythrin
MNYRSHSSDLLESAKNHLASNHEFKLNYAALDLRMLLEALIYDRARVYQEELPVKAFRVWQPKKLLEFLLEVDSYADQGAGLAIGINDKTGEPSPEEMKSVGQESVLSLKQIKKYYNKVGAFLHTPTLENVKENKSPTPEKILKTCNELVAIAEQVLSSPIFNLNIKNTLDWTCHNCGAKVFRRIRFDGQPTQGEELHAPCPSCEATFTLRQSEEYPRNYAVKPDQHDIPCSNRECDKFVKLWTFEVRQGVRWECPSCKQKNQFRLGVFQADG